MRLRPSRLLLAACLILAAGRTPADEPKGAATPDELFEKMTAAQKANDIKAQAALLGGPHRPLVALALEVFGAGEALDKALEAKFGKDPKYRSKWGGPSDREKPKAVELKGKKELAPDRLELTIWTTRVEDAAVSSPTDPKQKDVITETRVVALKEKGGWVVESPVPFGASQSKTEKRKTPDGKEIEVRVSGTPKDPSEAELKMIRETLPKIRAVLEQGTKDVAAGKYATRQEAVTAVEKGVQALFPKSSSPLEPPAKSDEPKKGEAGKK